MRIALVVPAGVGRDAEYHVIPALLWLIERLARRHDVQVVALRQEPEPASWHLLGAKVHNVGSKAGRRGAIRTLLRLHRNAPFDVFHAIWAGDPGAVALAAGRICRRPVLVHAAGGEFVWLDDIRFGSAGWRRALARAVVRHADRVTAASGLMLDYVRAAGAGNLGRAASGRLRSGTEAQPRRDAEAMCVPLGVDTTCWIPEPPRPRATDRPPRIVSVGSLTPVKDHAMLLRATDIMHRAGCPVQLDLVGEDTSGGVVPRLADELGIAGHVDFHGFLTQRRAVPIVRAADLIAVTSRHEAGPVAMLEAAAVGVPAVGTPVGHLRDWAPDAAVAVPFGDAGALARAVMDLLGDDERRLELARRAQQRAVRQDADWTCARFEELYHELVHGVAASAPLPGVCT